MRNGSGIYARSLSSIFRFLFELNFVMTQSVGYCQPSWQRALGRRTYPSPLIICISGSGSELLQLNASSKHQSIAAHNPAAL